MQKSFFLWILFFPVCMQAQSLSIKDEQLKTIISKVVQNFPRVKELAAQQKINDVKDELTNTAYLPTINADLNYRLSAPVPEATFVTPAGKQTLSFQPLNNYNTSVTINQLIYDFGKTKMQLERSKKDRQLTSDNIENTKNALAYQASQVYYTIQYLSKAIAVEEEQIKALLENERIVKEKFDKGDALKYDVLTNQVRTSTAVNRQTDLKSQLNKQYIILKWLTGEDLSTQLKFTEEYSDFTIITKMDDWQQKQPDAKVLLHRIDAYRCDIKLVDINNRPSLFTRVTGGLQNGIQPDINRFRPAASIVAGLSIPIIPANRPKLQKKLIQTQINITELGLLTIESNLQKDLATVQEDYNNLQLKLNTTMLLVKQAKEAYDLALIRYKAGLITNAELMLAQNNTEEANLQMVQLNYQMQLDKIQSHLLIGAVLYQ